MMYNKIAKKNDRQQIDEEKLEWRRYHYSDLLRVQILRAKQEEMEGIGKYLIKNKILFINYNVMTTLTN